MRIASLNYLKRFKCITTKCEDNCCAGWEIRVDSETALRCAESGDEELKKIFLERFVPSEKDSITPAVAGRFKLKSGPSCSFLEDEKLCSLHKRFGDKYLPCICYRYPKEENIVGELRERSATISCPEIARLVLLSNEPIQFELEGVEDQWPHLMHRRLDTATNTGPTAYRSSFPEVRLKVLTLLQDQSLPFETRMSELGRFCEKLALLIDQKNFFAITAEVTFFKAKKQGWFSAPVRAPNEKELANLIRALCDYELIEKVHFGRYQSCLSEVRNGYARKISYSDAVLARFFLQMEKKYMGRFFKKYPRFLENFVVNLVLKQLFPFEEDRMVRDQYNELLLQYAIARLHLTASAMLSGGINEKQAVAVMHTFARTWDSNASYRRMLIAGFAKAEPVTA